jgi:hypothetical protein
MDDLGIRLGVALLRLSSLDADFAMTLSEQPDRPLWWKPERTLEPPPH